MKRLVSFLLPFVSMVFACGQASAEPRALPAGAEVVAICSGDGMATVNIKGVKVESFEEYFYFKKTEILAGASKVTLVLDEGRRFNFTHSGGYYAGLAKEMAKKYGYPPSFLGNNIDVDSSDQGGSTFIVTCPSVKKRN